MAATHSAIGSQNICTTHSFVKTGGWNARKYKNNVFF